ncbi:MAG TPA: beta-galactosidase, partial [bacterium]|nr:beta-galactosidase [bacterium]
MQQPFLLGVNYWPRRKAMYWWSDFDAGEVREEFALIREIGLEVVRLFLTWEDWQPVPDVVDPGALNHFEEVCEIAAGLGLRLNVTFFTGHMSGPSWTPSWMLHPGQPMPPRIWQVVSGGRTVDCGYRNPFTDPLVLRAEELQLRTVVSRFRQHPAIEVWNLGNEPDIFAWPADAAGGKEWT